jgi:hypothetical protein
MLMKTPNSELASAAEIATGVRKSREQIDLEHRHDELRRQRDEVQELIRQAAAGLGRGGFDQVLLEKHISALSSQKASLDTKLYDARRALGPLRQEHSKRVREALNPVQSAAAQRVLDAAAELRAAVHVLAEVSDEITRAGGGLDLNRPSIETGPIEMFARQVLQKSMVKNSD